MQKDHLSKILAFLVIILLIVAATIYAIDYFKIPLEEITKPIVSKQLYYSESEKTLLKNDSFTLELKSNFELVNKITYYSENPNIASVDENGKVKANENGSTNIIATYDDMSLSIKINVVSDYYTITYNLNAINQKSVTEKCPIKDEKCTLKLKKVINIEYELKGWTLVKDSDEIFNFGETMIIDKNTTFYLVATKNNITVTYFLNGSTAIGKLTDGCSSNSCEIILPEISRKGNSEILGWSTNSNNSKAEYKVGDKITVSKNTNFYAITKTKFIATFYNNGANSIVGGSKSSWTIGEGYIQTSCYVQNQETSCNIYSPESIDAGTKEAVGFNIDKKATVKTLGYNQKLALTSDINYYAIVRNKLELTSMYNYSFPEETAVNEKKTLKILVIEINPILYSITNADLYKNNDGHPKVSEYFGQDSEKALSEMVKDLEDTSHGYLKISLKREWLNEFPTYKQMITLNDGTQANRFDEATYVSLSRDGNSDQGNWLGFINGTKLNEIMKDAAYSYDYDYLINKYNLINRRNKGEFDQVWLLSIDPTQTYETIMIGNNPYWINAPGYKANCQNFQLANISISRRDANLHALGHGVEGIMRAAFHRTYSEYGDYHGTSTYRYYMTSYKSYDKDSINVATLDDYNKLNLWEKFALGIYSNKSNLSSVGNIHFTFNGASGYDYSNTTKVYTNWRDWLNYPNLEGNFILDNNNAWLTNAGNNDLDSTQNKDPDRLYTRFWFYLMPHMTGYTEDGHLNNWWEYFYSLDFVTSISATNQTFNVGDKLSIKVKSNYNSGKSKNLTLSKYEKNMTFSDKSLFSIDSSGNIYASKKGTTTFKYYLDNKNVTITLTIK